MTKANILVVGGAGYIGSHMVAMLARQGYSVVVLDNLSTGYADAIIQSPDVRFVYADLANNAALEQCFATTQFDAVMHFAAFMQVGESVQHPGKYYRNNVSNTIDLLDVMLKYKVYKFIFSSTAAIYGEPQSIPIDIDHPKTPVNPYGRSKWMVEQILQDYSKAYGLRSISLRYFNAAGADPSGRIGEHHNPETHLIPLILQVASGRRSSINVYGADYDTPDGTCIRDYVHVLDLCSAHLLAFDKLGMNMLGGANAYNLGNGRGYSVREVINIVESITGHQITIVECARREGDPAVLLADTTRAQRELNWQPQYCDLETIIRHAWQWELFLTHSQSRAEAWNESKRENNNLKTQQRYIMQFQALSGIQKILTNPANITVFGAGYVGLVTAVCLAELGNKVLCVEVNKEKIALLQQGKSPIYERGMNEILTKNIAAQKLQFTDKAEEGIKHGDFLFIAVGTPATNYGAADLQYVFDVTKSIGQQIAKPTIVIDKSTVPVGTGDRVREIITEELLKRGVNVEFTVASNPEFLKQGDAISDFMRSDRIIIGADDAITLAKMEQLYTPLKTHVVTMDVRSAEFAKYAANAFLATKISFINEIAWLAEKLGADVSSIRTGIGTDPRIGMEFLNAGCGYGGSCFPKDVKALIWMAHELNCEVPLFEAVENINFRQKCLIFNRLKKRFNNNLRNKTIALWGLAFKPETDDMRDAPSKMLMELLWQEGAKVQAYDPIAMEHARHIYGERKDLTLSATAAAALKNADALVIVTEWQEFRTQNLASIKKALRFPIVFDGRNLYNPQQMSALGIEYYDIGRRH